ncbi:BRCT domain-containing protein [Plasmodiophora brassicae]|uniref:BRCT domain-containing protein n=1 Tax=Plasmodiophora brassicae TaxID=37360 RepID=A0A0G4IYC4_PLABS|nr:hypothetical protein PBRA_001407 [Plasmodiophora brassicae]SPQ94138.1 unnamed protein product [Plasmodiophora brassicae]
MPAALFEGLRFWIPPCPERPGLRDKIRVHGGEAVEVVRLDDPQPVVLATASRRPLYSDMPDCAPVYSARFIDNSIAANARLNLDDYMLTDRSDFSRRHRAPYEPDEDSALLQCISANHASNSLAFFEAMESARVLHRTAKSMRARYQVIIQNCRDDSRFQKGLERLSKMRSPDRNRGPSAELDAVKRIMQETDVPIEVALHALIVSSADEDVAMDYLIGNMSDGAWDLAEDEIILDGNPTAIRELLEYRSKDSLDRRRAFLQGLGQPR